MVKHKHWGDWYEVMVAPIYGGEQGCPEIVLTFSVKDAFEQARTRWPSAGGWDLLGFVDPDDRECLTEGSLQASQRLVTEEYE